MARLSNPLAFTPGPVTFLVALIYTALIVVLVILHTTVPPPPSSSTPVTGIDLTEAWRDLQSLTTSYHPYNSPSNDRVRDWLMTRIDEVLEANGVKASRVGRHTGPSVARNESSSTKSGVYIFDDLVSNLTFYAPGSTTSASDLSIYFEGTNIIVYVPGSSDDETEWWNDAHGEPQDKGGVLVNAHYDSVSTGFGATDDGIGVVTILQLIKYYTTPGHTPRRGLVALFNNGEEDYLNGARAFSQHSLAKFPHAFLNLEGAGAGGKATLFRSTDAEVTASYARSPYPFGNVLSRDGFQRGLIRSQTDYVVFNDVLGLRGLDVAFMEPRARYHTDEDDTRHTSRRSLWHMLSSALRTTQALTSDDGFTFEGDSLARKGVKAGHGHRGVWFDLFGRTFVVFRLHTLFALSVTLLVVAPVTLVTTLLVLYTFDKMYLFSGSRMYHLSEGDQKISLHGWRGFLRFPPLFILAAAAPVALAYLIFEMNPFIAHSSEWAVWSMMFSSWLFVAWFFSRVADWGRPSALTRAYGLTWLLTLSWVFLVVDTVFQTHLKLAGGYFVLFYFASLFLVTWISYLELFALPTKAKYSIAKMTGSRRESMSSAQPRGPSSPGAPEIASTNQEAEEGQADENTSLLKKDRRTTFANYTRNDIDEDQAAVADESEPDEKKDGYVFGEEQEWSEHLPRWTWLLQIILLVPINVILLGQMGLFLVSALHQTGPDGSSMFTVYLAMAAFSILILSPTLPYIHRFTWHIPMFMLLVLIGTLLYNLLAFPFSEQNRLKLFFQQEVDLMSSENTVSLIGPAGYVQEAISALPSSSNQSPHCETVLKSPKSRVRCSWAGLPPAVVHFYGSRLPYKSQVKSWVNYNVTRPAPGRSRNSARFTIMGRDTRACKLVVESPISITDLHVHGSGRSDKRFHAIPTRNHADRHGGGGQEIRLWSRTWNRAWVVDVEWDGVDENEGQVVDLAGKAVCLWSDDNHRGVIPALDEIRHFAPLWTAVTKAGDGLVEGFKRFEV